ncbi:hypothetical protein SAMN05216241_11913 [Limimonas halophila]|uniref:Uncharacterized protein n=1 Tax=Limimonas halophila TaxID=1082479 RepID=A0A1G7V0G6_9PROT|nr:hypothetical protein [Limimonas halophila]SDG53283.1 hypothetical protein SAMN05216241_11913 [Limimonas halophila]
MAFRARNLSVLAYANGFTLWHYITEDTGAAATADGYFDAACEMLRVGDVLVANLDADGDADTALLAVRTSGEEGVRVRDLTAGTQPTDG